MLARAVTRIEDNPLPARISPPIEEMFAYLAPETAYPNRAVFANLWLFEPIVLRILSAKNSTNATVRTTTAVTVFNGGVRENVLPKSAHAKVNFRIAPGETIESVKAHVADVVDDESVSITAPTKGFNSNPTPMADPDGPGFKHLQRAIGEVWGNDVVVAPS
ncbi:MAG: peptidase dimerization domain-containing protein [bacterium]